MFSAFLKGVADIVVKSRIFMKMGLTFLFTVYEKLYFRDTLLVQKSKIFRFLIADLLDLVKFVLPIKLYHCEVKSMLYKTHAAVGVASALAIVQPKSISELIVGCAAGITGGVICDIDSGTSTSHKEADRLILLILLLVCGVAAAENIWHLGIYEKISGDAELIKIIIAAAVFITVCLIGKQTPHRSFMHSGLCFVIMTVSVSVFLPVAAPYFGIAFASHVLLDFLNKKKIRLLYPLKTGFSLDVCRSDGVVNSFFFFVGLLSSVALIIYFAYINFPDITSLM